MKLTALLIAAILLCNSLLAQEVLTNAKIIELHRAGFSKEILKSKIQSSPSNFDVTIDGLMKLKKSGVPDDVINMMIAKPEQSNNITTTKNTTTTNNNANASQTRSQIRALNLSSGIYYKNPQGQYTEIEPSGLTGTKSNNAAQIFISSLINSKLKATLSGKAASFAINESIPKIVFIFDTTQRSNLNNDNNQFFNNARSPKEFILVKMDVTTNAREITIGKSNLVAENAGIDDKSVYHYSTQKISNGVYEIVPEKPLPEGEYCIMFSQGMKRGESTKAFDFSIRK